MLVIKTNLPFEFIDFSLLNSCIRINEKNKVLAERNKQKDKSKVKKSFEERVCDSFISKGITPEFIEKLIDVNPICAINFILKEAAIILDSTYKENHIKDCKYVYMISPKGNVYKSDNTPDLFKIHPLFRTQEDAYKARKLVIDIIKNIF